IAGRQRHELLASAIVEWVLDNEKRTRTFLSGALEGCFNVTRGTGAYNFYLSFDQACRFLQFAQLKIGRRTRGIDQHTKRRGSRNKFVQKLEALGLQIRPEKTHARDITPRSIEARDDADHDRIAGADEDNRNLGGSRLCYWCGRGICGDHSYSTTHKIGSH